MLRVGCTAAIAGEQKFAAVAECVRDCLDNVRNRDRERRIVKGGLDRIARANQIFMDRAHRRTCHISYLRSPNLTDPKLPPASPSSLSKLKRSARSMRNIINRPLPRWTRFHPNAPLANAILSRLDEAVGGNSQSDHLFRLAQIVEISRHRRN